MPPTDAARLLEEGIAILSAAGVKDPRRRARHIISAVGGIDFETCLLRPQTVVAESDACRSGFRRHAAGEPVSRIAGQRAFWQHTFRLSPATLDPRPETETLIEAALDLFADRTSPLSIADLGTGTGAIALSLLHELRSANVVAIDRSPEALVTARANATTLEMRDRVRFVCCDWLAAIDTRFDLIVSNPPYVRTGDVAALPVAVRDFDPLPALDGGPDGLDCFRAILREAASCLCRDGWILFEVGDGMADAVVDEASDLFDPRRMRRWTDLSGTVRVVGMTTRRC